jgi:hypothetical protein
MARIETLGLGYRAKGPRYWLGLALVHIAGWLLEIGLRLVDASIEFKVDRD